jgi:glutamate-5-semialdehyde dehydrogenase
VATATTSQKNDALQTLARELVAHTTTILAANELDLEAGRARGQTEALLDRLRLTPERVSALARAVQEVATLPDPVGKITDTWTRPNGLQVARVRIPLGVVAMVYESRPNVTVDAAALGLKSGNAVVLKGGSEALNSNRALLAICRSAWQRHGLPVEAVGFVDSTDRGAVLELLQQSDSIDLVIPRGGEGLIRFVTENSRIPVVQHYKGVCHLYVDDLADLHHAVPIVLNAKAQRPGTCNALEALLVHERVAEEFLGLLAGPLRDAGVQARGCPLTCSWLPGAVPATEADFGTEFLDLVLAVKVVSGLDEAIEHIERHGSGHTDGILTQDISRAREFTRRIDSSCVVVNASTRFNDGGELGLGAEIGISTSKLHAFGPMGLEELTTRKFVVLGEGHVRT